MMSSEASPTRENASGPVGNAAEQETKIVNLTFEGCIEQNSYFWRLQGFHDRPRRSRRLQKWVQKITLTPQQRSEVPPNETCESRNLADLFLKDVSNGIAIC